MNRTRFTATMLDGSKHVIMAHATSSVISSIRDYYEKKGHIVLKVEKGDYRKQERNAATKAKGGFRVSQKALKEAIKTLGLKLPVNVRFNARVGNKNGNYRLTSMRHNIMLKSYLTAEQASCTLWHELTHALQAERALAQGKTWTAVSNDQRKYSYKVRPIELEARAMSERMKDTPLCF